MNGLWSMDDLWGDAHGAKQVSVGGSRIEPQMEWQNFGTHSSQNRAKLVS